MATKSMTGFGRADGAAEGLAWHLEMKSVNGRGLDVRCRLPAVVDGFEAAIRERLGHHLARGNVNVTINLAAGSEAATLVLNNDVLDQYVAAAKALATRHGLEMPRAADLLALRGVADFAAADLDEEAEARLRDAVLDCVDRAAAALNASRAAEGERLAAAVGQLIDRIAALVAEAEGRAEAQPVVLQMKLGEALNRLLADRGATIDPDRMAQEVALLASKADIREELDRLGAHVISARKLLAEEGGVGRALEFLTQEFVREANTLCSKSSDNELTRIGLDLKAVIEQVREQIKNLE